MNTNTPKRVKEDDTDSLASTPFRERALQEQRLKEELFLTATPGWGKETPERRHVDTFSRDPSEVKGYLRDLSSVLVSQGRNLTGSLVERASSVEEASSKDEGNAEIRSSSKVPMAEPPLVQRLPNSITDLVFSRLESTIQKPKIRKIHGLVIRDMETSSAQDRQSPETQFSQSLKSSPATEENGNVLQQYDVSEEQLMDNRLEITSEIEPANQFEVTQQIERTPLVASRQNSQSPESDQEDSTELEPESMDPPSLIQLKHCLSQFMNENGIKLGEGSWRSLQDASVTLVERLVIHFTEEKSQKKIVLYRRNILKMLEKYELIPPNATNDDIFEMCCKYLPLESLNKLELALFF